MMKAMCNAAIVIGLLVAVVFLIDITPLMMPFGRPSAMLNLAFILGGAAIAYLGWAAKRELR